MICVVTLIIILFWILIGKRWHFSTKVMFSMMIFASYIAYLYSNGATSSEIIEVLFPFNALYR